ncbi:hypothetical protein B5X24_HaOG211712 [Helicoverpa armigera]|nr:hypothetical protein B5X24_HaOG211712 [Helicoverpa armigera]
MTSYNTSANISTTTDYSLHPALLVMDILGDLAEYINIIALDIYLPVVKTNRNVWREFFDKKSKQKALEMK